jgi:uracil-DNA glycosylase
MKIPPSLRNMYKERKSNLNLPIPKSGDLQCWAKQGVLMLNAFLTVEEKKAGAHAKWGWKECTDCVITTLSKREAPLVFLLWEGFAQKKYHSSIQASTVLSPLYTLHHYLYIEFFFGSRPYSKVNDALKNINISPIDWSLPSTE